MEIIKNRLKHYGEAIIDTDTIDEGIVVIVPDVNPDALQIIGTEASVYLQEKSCTDGVFKAVGSVNCVVCYLSTEGRQPHTVSASIPFTLTKEISGMTEDDRMAASVRLLSVTSSMVNPRKLSLKAQMQLTERLYKCDTVEYAEDILSGGDDMINCLGEKINIETISDVVEKRVVLSDEIRLNDEKIDGSCLILKKTADWVCEDIKVLPNKIMLRGRVDTTALFMDGQGEFAGKNKFSVPFSQIVECDGVMTDDEIDITFAPAREEIELFTSSEGVTTMTFAFAAVTECVIRRRLELDTVKDTYSTRWEMKDSRTSVTTALTEKRLVTVPVRESLSLDAPATGIIDISVTGCNMAVKRGESTVGGNYYISLICRASDGTVMSCGKKAYVDGVSPSPFEFDGWCAGGFSDASCEINGEGEAVVTFNAIFTCAEGHTAPVEIVSGCELDKGRAKESKSKASLIIKQTDRTENVWQIAKAYNTSPAVIASANQLAQDETVNAGRLILIPFVNR